MKWKMSYVFFVELALVDDGFVGSIDMRELLFSACGERKEEVGDNECLNEHMSSKRKIAYLRKLVWGHLLSTCLTYFELK